MLGEIELSTAELPLTYFLFFPHLLCSGSLDLGAGRFGESPQFLLVAAFPPGPGNSKTRPPTPLPSPPFAIYNFWSLVSLLVTY